MANQTAPLEQRGERRSNLFVIAGLYCQGQPVPIAVRVRNLSPAGGLIEGEGLPTVGSAVRLSRGSRSVDGEVLWRTPTHAGLRFDCVVQVSDWLPGTGRDRAQQRVDRIIVEARAAPVRSVTPALPLEASRPDYAAIALALTEAGETLIADPDIAQRHLGALQAIDIATQALSRLADDQ